MLRSHDLTAIGQAADIVSRRLHPEPFRTYNIDRNINYSNVCAAVCDFCAFYRPVGHDEAYVLSEEVLDKKIQETIDLGEIRSCCKAAYTPSCRWSGTKTCCEA
ncbi:MAG: hypothetical protein R3B91_05630 [Planctomycetaceae bacterium]